MHWGRRLQVAAVVLLLAAYAALSHYSNSHAQAHDLATLLALAPMLCFALALLWRWRGVLVAAFGAAASAVFLYLKWPLFTHNFSLVYLVQQAGFYALMALTFGVSLLGTRVPLCTQMADKVHGPLNGRELRYTRQVTAAWTLFFLLNMLAALLLCEFAPLYIWSMLANFCSLPLIALMFIGEYAVRRRVLPQAQTGGLAATLRVYFADPR